MGAVVSTSSCCAQRDRNDKEIDIELRNDKFFLFNYPQVIRGIDSKLDEVKSQEELGKDTIGYLKRMQSMLI